MPAPDKNKKFPLHGYENLCFLKNIITNSNIIVGDYTYYDDFETVENFEKNVKYHFDFINDKLIIGKFCMIASGVYHEWGKPSKPIIIKLSFCYLWS